MHPESGKAAGRGLLDMTFTQTEDRRNFQQKALILPFTGEVEGPSFTAYENEHDRDRI